MIAILSDPGVGGTFLSWTLHYLSGHKCYWNCWQNQLMPLTDQPLTQINSHNFKPNCPNTLEHCKTMIKSFDLTNNQQFVTMLVYQFRDLQDTHHTIDLVQQTADKLIFLTQSSNSVLYQCRYKPRTSVHKFLTNQTSSDPDELYEDFVEYFFADSHKTWQDANLNQIWDKREFIALNFDPYKIESIKPFLDYTVPHYNIEVFDHWNSLDTLIPDLFDNLDLVLDSSRFELWLGVYRDWQKLHHQNQRFIWYFEKIIQYIVEGYSMDLDFFKLDIIQEAAIQRELIYKYGLNLKTWQLEKFRNTQQLHKLLEPNIHPLH